MATKEVMVSAPLVVLLYDRAFVAGSFPDAWRRRWGLYLALAGTWLLLGWLVLSTDNRGGTAGFGTGTGCWPYLYTQFGAICHYLRLCFWPRPLVLDYGPHVEGWARVEGWALQCPVGLTTILPCAVVVGLLVAATLVALWRWPKVGFLGAWFLAILAPTSSVMPLADATVEHRMYLPLAAVVAGVTVGGCLAGGWLRRGRKGTGPICAKHPTGGHRPKAGRGKLDCPRAAGGQAPPPCWPLASCWDCSPTAATWITKATCRFGKTPWRKCATTLGRGTVLAWRWPIAG